MSDDTNRQNDPIYGLESVLSDNVHAKQLDNKGFVYAIIGSDGKTYVLKRSSPEKITPEGKTPTEEEIRLARTILEHEYDNMTYVGSPRIPKPHKFISPKSQKPHAVLILEYIDGESFYECAHKYEEADTFSILAEASEAVADLHERNVFHADLKPENILVKDPKNVYLIDLETAHRPGINYHDDKSPYSIINQMGSHYYMSPEHSDFFYNNATYRLDKRSDIYQLGNILKFACELCVLTKQESDGTIIKRRLAAPAENLYLEDYEDLKKLIESATSEKPGYRPTIEKFISVMRQYEQYFRENSDAKLLSR